MAIDFDGNLVLNKSVFKMEGKQKNSKFDNIFWTANDLLLVFA